jgi:Cu/Ag efflux pump CusA
MRWLIGSSLRLRRVVAVFTGLLIAAGVWQLKSAQVDSLPEFTPTTVQVQTEALGLSAPEVEQLITVPLEQDLLAGTPWLDTMRSESIPGLSSIEMIFEPGTDLLRARQVVQERMTQAAGLPNVSSTPQMLQPLASTSRIMMIRLSSESVTPIELSVLARWTLRPALLGVPGVANVSIWGQRERQLQVQVDPVMLAKRGVSLQDVIETTGNSLWASPLTFLEANTPGTGGFVDTANQRLTVQHLQPITDATELAKVPIDVKGKTLLLGDIANVVEDHQPLIGDAVFTDGNSGLLLVVEKFPNTNTVDVTREVESKLDSLRPGLTGITVDASIYRPATYVERSVSGLGRSALIGLLLLVLALVLFASSWRVVVISLVAAVVALFVAWLVLYLSGTSFNTIVVVGLVMALAAIIDDAVTSTENMVRRLRAERMNGTEPRPMLTSILEASVELRGSAMFAFLIAIFAVVPLLFLRGVSAAFMPTIIWTYAMALAVSMVVALIVTPAFGLLLLQGAHLRREAPVAAWLRRGYGRILTDAQHAKGWTYAGAALMALVAVATVPFMTRSTLPSFRDGNILVDLRAAPGTSLPEMDRITTRVGQELAALTGVSHVSAHVGRAVTSDQVVGVDAAELWVTVDPSADYDETARSIRAAVDGYPGIERTVQTYTDAKVAAAYPNTEAPVAVRLYGQDLDVLRGKADEVVAAISGVEGIVAPHMELEPTEPSINVSVNLQKADRYGVVPGDVRRSAATLLSGIGVGSLFEQQKVFDVVVWGAPDTRTSLDSVRGLLIDAPGGRQVRLDKVADVTVGATPLVIRHLNSSRSIEVIAGVQGRNVGAVTDDVRTAVAGIAFPLEYHAEVVSDYADQRADDLRGIAVAVAAAILIFLLLQAAFTSWRLAAVMFLAFTFALAGGLVAIALTGSVVSLGSIVGLAAVFGIAVRTGVTLVRRFRQLEHDEGIAFGPALIQRAAGERVVPIVASATAAGFALLPWALSGAAGEEIVQPMAVVMIGGLIASVLLNLLVVPNLYLRFGGTATPVAVSEETVAIPEIDHVPGV